MEWSSIIQYKSEENACHLATFWVGADLFPLAKRANPNLVTMYVRLFCVDDPKRRIQNPDSTLVMWKEETMKPLALSGTLSGDPKPYGMGVHR